VGGITCPDKSGVSPGVDSLASRLGRPSGCPSISALPSAPILPDPCPIPRHASTGLTAPGYNGGRTERGYNGVRTERVACRPPLSAVDGGGDPALRSLSAILRHANTGLTAPGYNGGRIERVACRHPLSAVGGGGDPALRSLSAILRHANTGLTAPGYNGGRIERVACRHPLSAVGGGGDPALRFLSDPTPCEHRAHRARLQRRANRARLQRRANRARRLPASAFRCRRGR